MSALVCSDQKWNTKCGRSYKRKLLKTSYLQLITLLDLKTAEHKTFLNLLVTVYRKFHNGW